MYDLLRQVESYHRNYNLRPLTQQQQRQRESLPLVTIKSHDKERFINELIDFAKLRNISDKLFYLLYNGPQPKEIPIIHGKFIPHDFLDTVDDQYTFINDNWKLIDYESDDNYRLHSLCWRELFYR